MLKIKAIGVGGGGSNTIDRLLEVGVRGVDFIVANTDTQSLLKSKVKCKVQLGPKTTGGLGAGADPGKGIRAAKESLSDIEEVLDEADLVFVSAGMGKGTGTGAASIIAEAALETKFRLVKTPEGSKKERANLVVGVVTRPFRFEGPQMRRLAEQGITVLKSKVDTLIVIDNDALLEVFPGIAVKDVFKKADDTLAQGIMAINRMISDVGMINIDFADMIKVMREGGLGFFGTGIATGENSAIEAAKKALENPLLKDVRGKKPGAALVNIIGGEDTSFPDFEKASKTVMEALDPDAEFKDGYMIDETFTRNTVRVDIITTKFPEFE